MARNPSGDRMPPENRHHRAPHPPDPAYIECDVPPGMTLGEWRSRDATPARQGLRDSLRDHAGRIADSARRRREPR